MTDIFPLLLLAVGLSMDAFAVSLCKGLSAKKANFKKFALVAAVFGGLQGVMPLIGYLFGRFFLEYIESYLGIISFIILLAVGAKMIYEGAKNLNNRENSQRNEADGVNRREVQRSEADELKLREVQRSETDGVNRESSQKIQTNKSFSFREIFVQGIATSIDALAVGVSLLNFSIHIAAAASVIAGITFCICFFGVFLGFKFGTVLKAKNAYADILGGIILIGIGIGFLF
jgi:putative Mn2+ efflux pump MntP